MSISVAFEDIAAHRVVAARISGIVTLANSLDAVRDLADRGRERRWNGLLADFWSVDRVREKPSIVGVYTAIKSLSARTGMSQGQRLAVLLNPVNFDPSRVAFYKLVRGNWGAPRFDFFTDEPAALGWLADPDGR